jgi:uncharacterized membrane protein YfcA
MIDPAQFALMAATAMVAAFVSSVAGSGLSAVLLPVLVIFMGVKEAIPILSFCLLAAASSRVMVNRREVVLPVAGWFLLGALPLVATGAWLFTIAPSHLLTRLLGVVLVAVVVWRRVRPRPPAAHAAAWFLPIGAGFGFLTGLSAGIGPLMAPFFLAYGLRKGSFVGTVGMVAFFLQSTKLIVFGRTDVLTQKVLIYGLSFIPLIVLGTVIGKLFMNRLSERLFERIIEGVMTIAGIAFIIRG